MAKAAVKAACENKSSYEPIGAGDTVSEDLNPESEKSSKGENAAGAEQVPPLHKGIKYQKHLQQDLLEKDSQASVDSGRSQCWHCAKSHNGMKSTYLLEAAALRRGNTAARSQLDDGDTTGALVGGRTT